MTEIRMTKTLPQAARPVVNFELWSFVLVSDFDIRISDLLLLPPQTRIVLALDDPPDVLGAVGRLARTEFTPTLHKIR